MHQEKEVVRKLVEKSRIRKIKKKKKMLTNNENKCLSYSPLYLLINFITLFRRRPAQLKKLNFSFI